MFENLTIFIFGAFSANYQRSIISTDFTSCSEIFIEMKIIIIINLSAVYHKQIKISDKPHIKQVLYAPYATELYCVWAAPRYSTILGIKIHDFA